MNTINYSIELTSDAEPASGIGTSALDSLLPRDINKQVILPASHLKGIIRENLLEITKKLGDNIIEKLFGEEGVNNSLFHLNDAVAPIDSKVIVVSRTKLNEFGTAEKGSLRASEVISVGTVFSGSINVSNNLSEEYKNLLKLGLLSLFAVGGGRNRGSGACVVKIENYSITPGELLKELAKRNIDSIDPLLKPSKSFTPKGDSSKAVLLKLNFESTNAVCVPEKPIVKDNNIISGFTIPASAVIGGILHRINDVSEELASACFANENFRSWPLTPIPKNSKEKFSMRVSFTHKLSKLKVADNFLFCDETIEPYDMAQVPDNAPLKSSDGVLIADNKSVELWKSGSMARLVTAHGVINGTGDKKRNLYTVESMAPTNFVGIVSMPEDAAELLLELLEKDSFMQLGKSRSVRGGGILKATKISYNELPKSLEKNNVFIVQSPILIPKEIVHNSVNDIIKKIVLDSGFGEVVESSGSITTLFGWSRHSKGNAQIAAKSVIEAGAVFKLKESVKDLDTLLLKGIGGGREEGFGSVLSHPGIAIVTHEEKPFIREIEVAENGNYAIDGFELFDICKKNKLSTSQLSRVRELLSIDIDNKKDTVENKNSDNAVKYLEKQKSDRPASIWEIWKGILDNLIVDIKNKPDYMLKVLKVCQDLLAAEKGNK